MHQRDDEELTKLLMPLARRHRYNGFEAHFKSTRDLSASWRVRFNSLEISISDYLADAPDEAILEFTEAVILVANGKKAPEMPTYMEWITSDQFIKSKRKLFVQRSKNLSRAHVGDHYDIMESVQRLLDSGLIVPSDIDNSYYTWTDRPNYRKVGYCSPLVRTVAISCALDDPKVPENVLDYVVFHETLHLRQGYRPFQRSHDRDFKAMERDYPGRKECEHFLKELKKNV